MARLARAVIPGLPHHVTQRGNRRQLTFFSESDYAAYIEIMAAFCKQEGVDVWGYCLMPNHVHLIAVLSNEKALARAVGEAHRRYTRFVNSREGWTGYLWQGRFASYVMDEQHLLACIRYVETNPVRGKLVNSPFDWRWSSAKAHASGCNDSLVSVAPILGMVEDSWSDFLEEVTPACKVGQLRRHERTGRPLGESAFVNQLENQLERTLQPAKVGRKPRNTRRSRL